jgi:hypothetical protein
MSRCIQHQAVRFDQLLAAAMVGTAQDGVDAGEQLARRERLGDVVVGAAFQAHHLVLLFRARRQHDDRHFLGFLVALERAGEFQAAHVRQHPVDQHEVGTAIGDAGPRRAGVGGFADVEAAATQAECNHFTDWPLVFDDQDLLGGHRDSNLTAWRAASLQQRIITAA